MRDYRARQRERNGTAGLTLVGPGNQAARKHGAYASDLDAAAAARLREAGMPEYLSSPQFADALEVVRRRVEAAQRIGRWVAGLSDEEQMTPLKAGSSAPAEVARLSDDSALRALSSLGLTPRSAVAFGRKLSEQRRPDIALLLMEAAEEDGGDESAGG